VTAQGNFPFLVFGHKFSIFITNIACRKLGEVVCNGRLFVGWMVFLGDFMSWLFLVGKRAKFLSLDCIWITTVNYWEPNKKKKAEWENEITAYIAGREKVKVRPCHLAMTSWGRWLCFLCVGFYFDFHNFCSINQFNPFIFSLFVSFAGTCWQLLDFSPRQNEIKKMFS